MAHRAKTLKGNYQEYSTSTWQGVFFQLIEKSAGIEGIGLLLSSILGNEVIIEDKFFHVLIRASAGKPVKSRRVRLNYNKPQLEDSYLKTKVQWIEQHKQPLTLPPLPHYGVNKSRLIVPITINGNLWGYLHNFDNEVVIPISRDCLIEAAVDAIKIEAMRQLSIEDVERDVTQCLWESLFNGGNLAGHISRIGAVKFGRPYRVVALAFARQIDSKLLAPMLGSIIGDLCAGAQIVSVGGHLILIIPENVIPLKVDGNRLIKTIAREIIKAVALHLQDENCSIKMGIGGPCSEIEDFRRSYEEALTAANVREKEHHGPVISFEDLGLISLLLSREQTRPQIEKFVYRNLCRLLEYDREHGADYLETLRKYLLDHDGEVKSTAISLHIHQNTLRYRLTKISELLGFNLANMGAKLELRMTLQLAEILDMLPD